MISLNYFNKNDDSVKNIDLVIVFLIFFTSLGWIVDSGTFFVKIIFFTFLLFTCAFRVIKFGVIGLNLNIFIFASPIIIMIFIGVFIHNRIDDILLLFKFFLSVMVLISISSLVFWCALHKLMKVLLPVIIIGFIFQQLNLTFEIPSIFLDQSKRHYTITPVFTVVRGDEFHRAFGPFWEPSILSFIANLSLISKLYFLKTDERKHYWVEALIIILSQSASGFIILFLAFIGKFIYGKAAQLILVSMFFSYFVILLGVDYRTFTYTIGQIGNIVTLNFLDRDLLQDPSFAARIADLYVPFLLGLKSFFGYSNINEFIYFSSSLRGHSAEIVTNSFGSISYFYGFPLMLLYLVVFSYSVLKNSPSRNLVVIPLLVFLYFSNPLSTVLFTIIFMLLPSQSSKTYRLTFNKNR